MGANVAGIHRMTTDFAKITPGLFENYFDGIDNNFRVVYEHIRSTNPVTNIFHFTVKILVYFHFFSKRTIKESSYLTAIDNVSFRLRFAAFLPYYGSLKFNQAFLEKAYENLTKIVSEKETSTGAPNSEKNAEKRGKSLIKGIQKTSGEAVKMEGSFLQCIQKKPKEVVEKGKSLIQYIQKNSEEAAEKGKSFIQCIQWGNEEVVQIEKRFLQCIKESPEKVQEKVKTLVKSTKEASDKLVAREARFIQRIEVFLQKPTNDLPHISEALKHYVKNKLRTNKKPYSFSRLY